jgi:hypothetical protein
MQTFRRIVAALIFPAIAWLGACDRPDAPTQPPPPSASLEVTPAAHGPHGPDAFGYTASRVPFTFEDISTTGTTVLDNTDDAFISVPIGFTFRFYGVPHMTVFVGTNGVLSFGAGNGNFTNMPFTGPVVPDVPTIAPLWDDWVTFSTADDRVVVKTVGEAGERQFIVQWHVVPHFITSPSTVTFQAVLFEESSAIEFRYLDTDTGDGDAFGASATVGIRDIAGHLSERFIEWSHNEPVIPNMSAIRIVLPSGKVTGGGQVPVKGGTGSFGFNAKSDAGVGSGHLNYLNHFTGAHLECTVTEVTALTTTMAEFSGTCRGAAAEFTAKVEDKAEPGKNADTFEITYNGNTEGGPLRSGNIEIHK